MMKLEDLRQEDKHLKMKERPSTSSLINTKMIRYKRLFQSSEMILSPLRVFG